jgi:diaminohydroxyphosphoribosylaminopyrimidine deaminase/5-amino-6-(5-phosphoribosylamino)uracil reductase
LVRDEAFLKRALKLAKKGQGYVSPNPMVGAVIVKDGEVVGEGFHQRFGGDHAEVEALRAAGEESRGATLYVNLEPCCHHGKTPPCVDRVIESGISRVVVGTQDPNPLVNGKGIETLRASEIEVTIGILENECRELNRAYFKHVLTGLPFTTLKVAQTLDGRIATQSGQSQWITSRDARRTAHQMRAEHDAVMVGIGTVLADDPELTVRLVRGPNPRRFIIDSLLRIPLEAKVLASPLAYKTVVVTTLKAPWETIKSIEERGAAVWVIEAESDGRVSLPLLWQRLGEEGIASVLVEGGSALLTEVLRAHLGDVLALFVAPKILGSGIPAVGDLGIDTVTDAYELSAVTRRTVGGDIFISGQISYSHKED